MFKQYRADIAPEPGASTLETFWEEHWGGLDIARLEQGLERTELWRMFQSFLPERGRVLEAGCGPGQWVKFLSERGYRALGLDLAGEALAASKRSFRSLPLVLGSVSAAPFRNDSLDAYVSLGVIEHFEDGPEPILAEARRIVKPGGVLLIAVPYLSLAKRYATHRAGPPPEGAVFYQYLMTGGELQGLLTRAGLDVVHVERYGVEGGLQNRVPALGAVKARLKESRRSLLKRALPIAHAGWDLFMRSLPTSVLAHMVMAVCRKPDR